MNQSDTIHLDIPASYKYLNVISECLTAMLNRACEGIPEGTVFNIQLAIQEVCTNIIDHAYGGVPDMGRINLTAEISDDPLQFIIDVYDSGTNTFELDPDPVIEIDEEPDIENLMTRGRGLFLIHQLMDIVEYTPSDGKNHWRIIKQLQDQSV